MTFPAHPYYNFTKYRYEAVHCLERNPPPPASIRLRLTPDGGRLDFSWVEIFIVVDGMSRDGR